MKAKAARTARTQSSPPRAPLRGADTGNDGETARRRHGSKPTASVVYTAPPLALAKVVGESDEGVFRVSVHGAECDARLDASVDPAVVREAMEQAARVVVEAGPEPVIVGTLVTARALTIDREGNVAAEVERIDLHVSREATIRTDQSFIRIRPRLVEQYATEVRVRARNLVQMLGALIRLN